MTDAKRELQLLIGKEDDERIKIENYKTVSRVLIIKNTYGVKCPNCGSENVHVEQKQIRSADEGATNFYDCLDCHHKWKRNN
jgi:DNA-directed RNA polymerase subunit M/transcription elongation factor TFIIS